jgi:hypothetical protein
MLTHKVGSSSRGQCSRLLLALILVLVSVVGAAATVNLSPTETRRIGKRVWQNECNGTLAGLTSWNEGENFASLGIGHFIWYPRDGHGPFQQSFPQFVDFAEKRGATVPADPPLKGGCPWNSRAEFQREIQSAPMKSLRQFLANSIDLQAEFLVERLRDSLPKMLAAAIPAKRAEIQERFDEVSKSPNGYYALVDYVNFKGEGVLATERYAGQGWGLLQVLEEMSQTSTNHNAVANFADSAKRVLATRVRNAPHGRNEARWLPGWLNRINTYTRD